MEEVWQADHRDRFVHLLPGLTRHESTDPSVLHSLRKPFHRFIPFLRLSLLSATSSPSPSSPVLQSAVGHSQLDHQEMHSSPYHDDDYQFLPDVPPRSDPRSYEAYAYGSPLRPPSSLAHPVHSQRIDGEYSRLNYKRSYDDKFTLD